VHGLNLDFCLVDRLNLFVGKEEILEPKIASRRWWMSVQETALTSVNPDDLLSDHRLNLTLSC
jgi:hypothetical protein